MLVAAGVLLETQTPSTLVDEARLPIPGVIRRIMNGDDILELIAHSSDALGRHQLIAVRKPARIQKRLIVEADSLDDERVTFVACGSVSRLRRIRRRPG